MFMKKILASTLAAGMVLSLAACGGSPAPASSAAPAPAPESAQPAAEAPKAAAEAVEINYWSFPNFGIGGEYERSVIEAFSKVHPEIKINLVTLDFQAGPEALVSAIEAGTAPDLLFDAPGRIIEYGRAGKLAPLTDMFTAEFVKDVNNDQFLQACKAEDVAYMYPISSAPFYMGLNKNMLEKANALQYVNLEGDRTWKTENFIKMCEALRDAGVAPTPGIVYCGAQGGDQGTRALVNNLYNSTGILASDGKWQLDDKAIQTLTLLQTMVTNKSLDAGMSMAAADALQEYQAENSATTICWGTSDSRNYASDTYTSISVPFPSETGVPTLEFLANGFCVFDNKDAAKIAASKEFIKFICDDPEWGPKSVVATGAFPVRTSYGDLYKGSDKAEEYALLGSWTKYYGPYYNTQPGFAAMRKEWWNMLQRVFQGGNVAAEAKVFMDNSNAALTA